MKDRKGNSLNVGDRVYVLPDPQTRTGGVGWVRRVIENENRARVDDGVYDDDWNWSAWVTPNEVEKVNP